MKIVIDIPDGCYEELITGSFPIQDAYRLVAWIKDGTPLPKWIPVSERLPENAQNVLFCDIEDDIMLGYHINGRPNTHFSQDGTFDNIKNVKAWMPLPEAYEESEVEG